MLNSKSSKLRLLSLSALAGLMLAGCGSLAGNPLRDQVADRVASPAWMVKREIQATPFYITAFERMHEPGQTATLYIEGDGEAPAMDPTPINPVALHLASKDLSDNLAYLARPCQYSGLLDLNMKCDQSYWGDAAYNAETLAAYNTAINKIKRRYEITDLHIVGYDSGATLAALLAAQRQDVLSLRTVAGEFDIAALGPHARTLSGIPQHHFAGGQDDQNSPAQLHSYLQMVGDNECTEYTLIQESEHEKGWVDKWPELLKEKVPACSRPVEPEFVPIEKPEPIFYPRMSGDKK